MMKEKIASKRTHNDFLHNISAFEDVEKKKKI